ncbi:hypothetical protein BDD12DRAFT_891570 [Trichophaea hybrida]|nr:hypothetical protein BDD12DRAFT_891570 [Trichophaea hybrida]
MSQPVPFTTGTNNSNAEGVIGSHPTTADPTSENIMMPEEAEVREWDVEKLVSWLQSRKPSVLKGANLEEFRKAEVYGDVFLIKAGSSRKRTLSLEEDQSSYKKRIVKLKKTSLTVSIDGLLGKIMEVSDEVELYCDPIVIQLLPFPYPGVVPKRFKPVFSGSQIDRPVIYRYIDRPDKMSFSDTVLGIDRWRLLHDASEGFPNERKQMVRSLLDGISAKHMKLASSTANYRHAQYDLARETSEGRMTLYGGLNEREMIRWWAVNEHNLAVTLSGEDKANQRFCGRAET